MLNAFICRTDLYQKDNNVESITRKCLWCDGYRRRIWTRRHAFKSWTWLIAFNISLIPLGKVWIQIFSLQLWVNSSLGEATRFFSLGEKNSEFKPVKLRLKTDLESYHAREEGLGKYDMITQCFTYEEYVRSFEGLCLKLCLVWFLCLMEYQLS